MPQKVVSSHVRLCFKSLSRSRFLESRKYIYYHFMKITKPTSLLLLPCCQFSIRTVFIHISQNIALKYSQTR